MDNIRRIAALLLIACAVPSLFWVVYTPISSSPTWATDKELFNWILELVFVATLIATASIVWRKKRYWSLVLLLVAGCQTYLVAGKLIAHVLISPEHWGYFKIVLLAAERRGFGPGTALTWELVVLPMGISAVFIISLWLYVAEHRANQKSEI